MGSCLMTIVFQSRLTLSLSLFALSLSSSGIWPVTSPPTKSPHRIPIEPYYEHEKHFEHVLCFLSQVHETFYTSTETTCIDHETILYRNLR